MSTIRVGIAYDEAFCFYYRENIRELVRTGFEPIYFSPLSDKELPADTAGLYIGGGYPELHDTRLADNKSLTAEIRKRILNGMPVIAECGGFMYMLVDINGNEMCGVINAGCTKRDRLVRFGYVEISDETGAWLSDNGRIRGHEFHYYDSDDNGNDALVRKAASGEAYRGIHITDNIWAGWPHLYFRSAPKFTKNFYNKCRDYIAKLC